MFLKPQGKLTEEQNRERYQSSNYWSSQELQDLATDPLTEQLQRYSLSDLDLMLVDSRKPRLPGELHDKVFNPKFKNQNDAANRTSGLDPAESQETETQHALQRISEGPTQNPQNGFVKDAAKLVSFVRVDGINEW